MKEFKEETVTQSWSRNFLLLSLQKKAILVTSSFTKKEKIFFGVFIVSALISGLGILIAINQYYMTSVPSFGGSFTEGIVGTPRFINPILSISDSDKDITALIYSGLLRVSEDGELIPDLASKYELSTDGLEYTFTLKDGVEWSDGQPLTSDDVKFTIDKIQDESMRSPRKTSLDGISVQIIDEKTVKLILTKPYAPFLENTTIGIIPKHIWGGLTSEQFGFSSYNTNPIGSGPYKIKEIKQNSSSIPEYYDLVPFKKFVGAGGVPLIANVRIRFYTGEEKLLEAYRLKEIDAISAISPHNAVELKKSGARAETAPLPRVFGVFMNQNEQEIFTDIAVRKALDMAIDKDAIINSVLLGFGTKIDGPLPFGIIDSKSNDTAIAMPLEETTEETRIQNARSILTKAGWMYDEDKKLMQKNEKGKGDKKVTKILSFSLSTSDAPELKQVAQMLKTNWEKIGAQIEIKVFEEGDLKQKIIRPRKYDALLYGTVVGMDPDPYAFWHSSQRFDPGLNIALYANIVTDKILETARTAQGRDKRLEMYKSFEEQVKKDTPAVFLYSPDFIYVLPTRLQGVNLSGMNLPSERFTGITGWYMETQNVWRIFAGNTK